LMATNSGRRSLSLHRPIKPMIEPCVHSFRTRTCPAPLSSHVRRRLGLSRPPPLPAVSNPPSVGTPNSLSLLLLHVQCSLEL
jgi:hypothetical protein